MPECIRKVHGEERIQLGYESALTTHHANQSVDILRYIEGVIERITLDKALSVGAQQAKRSLKCSLVVAGTCVTHRRIKHVLVVGCPFLVAFGYLLIPTAKGCLIDGPIVVGIF